MVEFYCHMSMSHRCRHFRSHIPNKTGKRHPQNRPVKGVSYGVPFYYCYWGLTVGGEGDFCGGDDVWRTNWIPEEKAWGAKD